MRKSITSIRPYLPCLLVQDFGKKQL